MPETDENKTIDIDTSGPEVEVKLPEEKQKKRTKHMKVVKTLLSPVTHLRNLVSSLMFKLKTVVLYNQLVSKGMINKRQPSRS